MKVVVFGANGKVGRLVVAELLEHDHTIVAFAHSTPNFEAHPNLQIVQGDIYNADDVTRAIAGTDAVVSALGSWGTSGKDVLTTAMQHIIPAMQASGMRRIISLTGSDARASGDSSGLVHWLSHLALSVLAGKVLRDGERHITLLEQSDLDWSVVRSPVMNESGDIKKYTFSSRRPLPWQTIHRHSVVKALVSLLETDEFSKQAPFLVRI